MLVGVYLALDASVHDAILVYAYRFIPLHIIGSSLFWLLCSKDDRTATCIGLPRIETLEVSMILIILFGQTQF